MVLFLFSPKTFSYFPITEIPFYVSHEIFVFFFRNCGNMPTTEPKRQGIGNAPPQYADSDERSCSQCSCPRHHKELAVPNKTDGYKLNFTFVPRGNIKLKIPTAKGDWAANLSFTAKDLPKLEPFSGDFVGTSLRYHL